MPKNSKLLPLRSLCAAGLCSLLCGCAGVDRTRCENFYPELPDNDYCFRKLKEYHEFLANPKNAQKTVLTTTDGKTRRIHLIVPVDSPEAYLGILLGRGAIGIYTVILTKAQHSNLFRNSFKVMPECLVDLRGSTSEVNTLDYFDDNNDAHLRTITFYYKEEKAEEFRKWLRIHLPPEDLPRRKETAR